MKLKRPPQRRFSCILLPCSCEWDPRRLGMRDGWRTWPSSEHPPADDIDQGGLIVNKGLGELSSYIKLESGIYLPHCKFSTFNDKFDKSDSGTDSPTSTPHTTDPVSDNR